ncbi:MAG: 50S ribosomal protein L13, partial [candidate division Zixibacteria bacterium]|nr:50S ribosomal protein L13 [candidate division Zixibacteria bacterium]
MNTKTFIPSEKDFKRKTYLIDASGKTLGRLATRIAALLIGKGKTVYTPEQLCGDQVVVINAGEVFLTGRKTQQKLYRHYSGYPGGLKTATFDEVKEKKPEDILFKAVSRMLPNNKLGREMARRLRVYAGAQHFQQA